MDEKVGKIISGLWARKEQENEAVHHLWKNTGSKMFLTISWNKSGSGNDENQSSEK